MGLLLSRPDSWAGWRREHLGEIAWPGFFTCYVLLFPTCPIVNVLRTSSGSSPIWNLALSLLKTLCGVIKFCLTGAASRTRTWFTLLLSALMDAIKKDSKQGDA